MHLLIQLGVTRLDRIFTFKMTERQPDDEIRFHRNGIGARRCTLAGFGWKGSRVRGQQMAAAAAVHFVASILTVSLAVAK